MYQELLTLIDGATYQYSIDLITSGKNGLILYIDTNEIESDMISETRSVITGTFVADTLGKENSYIEIYENWACDSATVYSVSLKKIGSSVDDGLPVKEFLSGTLDGEQEIHFRADTQMLQMMPEFEKYATPTAIVTKMQRGAAIETFVSLDAEDFYQLDGNATKGMTVQKIYSKDKSVNSTPPMARKIMISWRDSSKQLCRITQGSVIFLPTNMDHSE